jgi:hypothetical protein
MVSYNDVLDELQYYILNETKIRESLVMKLDFNKNEKNTEIKKNNVDIILKSKNIINPTFLFFSNHKDGLFWCFFVIKFGELQYSTIYDKNFLIVKQHKINFILTIRNNKEIVKTHKFDSMTNIESNLANDDKLSSKTFLTLCAIENINIIFVSKKTYYELITNDSNIIYVVYELPQNKYNNKYGFNMADEQLLKNIRNSLYKLDFIDKPLKSISSYKVQDLVEICNKLAIETINTDNNKKKTKIDLYESIIKYFLI